MREREREREGYLQQNHSNGRQLESSQGTIFPRETKAQKKPKSMATISVIYIYIYIYFFFFSLKATASYIRGFKLMVLELDFF